MLRWRGIHACFDLALMKPPRANRRQRLSPNTRKDATLEKTQFPIFTGARRALLLGNARMVCDRCLERRTEVSHHQFSNSVVVAAAGSPAHFSSSEIRSGRKQTISTLSKLIPCGSRVPPKPTVDLDDCCREEEHGHDAALLHGLLEAHGNIVQDLSLGMEILGRIDAKNGKRNKSVTFFLRAFSDDEGTEDVLD